MSDTPQCEFCVYCEKHIDPRTHIAHVYCEHNVTVDHQRLCFENKEQCIHFEWLSGTLKYYPLCNKEIEIHGGIKHDKN